SPVLVAVAVAGLFGWAAVHAAVLLRHGWARWAVAADAAVTAVLCLGYGRLVPATVLPGWSTWLAVVASSAVVLCQLSPWPVLGAGGGAGWPALRAEARRDLGVVEVLQAPTREWAATGPAGPQARAGHPGNHGAGALPNRGDLRGWLAPLVSAQPGLTVQAA